MPSAGRDARSSLSGGRWPLVPLLALALGTFLVGVLPGAQGATGPSGAGDGGFHVTVNASVTWGAAPLIVRFVATTQGDSGHGVRLDWGFGDHGAGHGVHATHTYEVPGIYTATLNGTDNGTGADAQSSVTIDVASASVPPSEGAPASGGTGPSLSVPPIGWAAILGATSVLVVAIAVLTLLVVRPARRDQGRRGYHPPLSPPKEPPHTPSPSITPKKATSLAPPPSSSPTARPGYRGRSPSAPGARRAPTLGEPSSTLARGPMGHGVIWVRDPSGPWVQNGRVPMREATPHWQKEYRAALGLDPTKQFAILPWGADPNRMFVVGTPEDPELLDLSTPRRSR
ncbi:MAG: PKD domain-containing protein [Euryarchaeota archaeon]|nr:PKD domain-containing protein [Euryarchaeota archaeon]MDE1837792.1 PKD domain-containing protein [Euryarchaeota archaeon]MDE1882035.1 PKD domain-containing protein [Euryarchaeota archaeon]MDE2046176.1 PKD domain-containing protein [Thermoplasmata archaeon]